MRRGALELFLPPTCPEESSPAWSTGRLWLLRIGLAALVGPKIIADDWVWMVNHSVQIGPRKCLVILGLRLSEFTIAGPLRHQDMALIDLVPMDSATKHTVAVCLEGAVAQTGAPARSSATMRPSSTGRSRSSAGSIPDERVVRHQAQGGVLAQGPAGGG